MHGVKNNNNSFYFKAPPVNFCCMYATVHSSSSSSSTTYLFQIMMMFAKITKNKRIWLETGEIIQLFCLFIFLYLHSVSSCFTVNKCCHSSRYGLNKPWELHRYSSASTPSLRVFCGTINCRAVPTLRFGCHYHTNRRMSLVLVWSMRARTHLAPRDDRTRVAVCDTRHDDRLGRLALVDRLRSQRKIRRIYHPHISSHGKLTIRYDTRTYIFARPKANG